MSTPGPSAGRGHRLSRDPGPVSVDIVLQWCKFLNKSPVNQIMYNQLTHSELGALGPLGLGGPGAADGSAQLEI